MSAVALLEGNEEFAGRPGLHHFAELAERRQGREQARRTTGQMPIEKGVITTQTYCIYAR